MNKDAIIKHGCMVTVKLPYTPLRCIYRGPSRLVAGVHIVDYKGAKFHIGTAWIDASPECGHSVCSQNFIDTGDNECVDPCVECGVPYPDHSLQALRQCRDAVKFAQTEPFDSAELLDDENGGHLS